MQGPFMCDKERMRWYICMPVVVIEDKHENIYDAIDDIPGTTRYSGSFCQQMCRNLSPTQVPLLSLACRQRFPAWVWKILPHHFLRQLPQRLPLGPPYRELLVIKAARLPHNLNSRRLCRCPLLKSRALRLRRPRLLRSLRQRVLHGL